MQIEEGKYYRTRDGRKVGPMKYRSWSDKHPWASDTDDIAIWEDDGTRYRGASEPETDLVALWYDDTRAWVSPIRTETVTTRHIEPGVYGRLSVRGVSPYPFGSEGPQMDIGLTTRGDDTVSTGYVLTAPELRELARVALELAEYLENA